MADLISHNKRVRALADRMPADMLRRAVCAIFYRADFTTGITAGFSVATMAAESRKARNLGASYAISPRQLKRAIAILAEAGVIRVDQPPSEAGRRQANIYHAEYTYDDDERLAAALETARRQRQDGRERAIMMAKPTAEWCAVCGGRHDPWRCDVKPCPECAYHEAHNAR